MSEDSRTNPTDVQAAAQATKPLFLTINDTMYWQAKSGEELKFNLDFPQALMTEASKGEMDDLAQFEMVLDSLGDKATVAKVKKMGALELARLVNAFFGEFQKAVDAPLGKSSSSSDS